ncbi:MAG: hypothetical protein JRN09_05110 [Nitrososphaerota archaeon]|nr:hypothetical protein [Nitrososphaerota archaeon]
MKTAKIAAIGAASTLAVVALLLGLPAAMAATNNPLNGYPMTGTALAASSSSQSILPGPTAMTVGQTISFTSTNGVFHVVGSPGKTGTASGTLTLTVAGAFKGGYALSIASGSLTINGTAYSIASGSAEMGPFQAHLVGQGSLASATPGSFLFAAGAHASFQGQTYNTLRFDVQTNGIEYGVLLLVTATVS